MQVNDGAQIILTAPVEGILQQIPSLRQLVAFLVPELHLVDGDTYKVEAQLLQTCEVVLLNVETAGFTTLFALRQPVAHVSSTLNAEVIHLSCLSLVLILTLVLARRG